MNKLALFILTVVAFSAFIFAESCQIEGNYRCTNTYDVERCALMGQNLVWVAQSSCAPPTVCVELNGGLDVACKIPICTTGDSKCADTSHISFCDQTGTDWKTVDCAPQKTCVQLTPTHAECQTVPPVSCNPGESRCKDSNVLQTCNSQGNGWNEESCAGSQKVCTTISPTQAVCEPQNFPVPCSPADDTCVNNKIYYCNPSGTGWIYEEDCTPSGATCVLDSSLTPKVAVCVLPVTCTPGEQRCNSNNVEICNPAGNGWGVSLVCPSSDQCVYNRNSKPPTASCQPIISCTPSFYRCDDDLHFSQCNIAGNGWIDAGVCSTGSRCVTSYGGLTVSCEQFVCTEGQTRCDPSSPTNEVDTCTNNAWALSKICHADEACSNGDCVPISTCTEGDQMCIGNDVYTCTLSSTGSTNWQFAQACVYPEVCAATGNTAACSVPSTPTNGGGSSGARSVGSSSDNGGGEISVCQKYSEWTSHGSTTYTETGSDGRTRQCTNTSLIRWCVGSDGRLIYSDSQTDSKSQCGDWSEKCEYIYSRTEKSTERSSNNCRDCQSQVYVYTCQPSGKAYPDNVQKKTSCTEWAACPAPAGAGTGNETSSQPTGVGAFLKDWGTVLGILILILLGIVAYTAWKMFGDEGEEGGDGEGMAGGPGEMGGAPIGGEGEGAQTSEEMSNMPSASETHEL